MTHRQHFSWCPQCRKKGVQDRYSPKNGEWLSCRYCGWNVRSSRRDGIYSIAERADIRRWYEANGIKNDPLDLGEGL